MKDTIGENAVIHVQTKSVQRTISSSQVHAKGFRRYTSAGKSSVYNTNERT